MINVDTEELVPFQMAAAKIPGRRICLQTLHRWRLNGIRGVKLETCVIGTTRYTSVEAIARFIRAQNTPGSISTGEMSEPESPKAKSGRVRRQAEKLGIA